MAYFLPIAPQGKIPWRLLKFTRWLLALWLLSTGAAHAQTTWTSQTAVANNTWVSVAYGNGLFVAISYDGTGNRVMTSPDGVNWTSHASAADNAWSSVTYGNGLFVGVAQKNKVINGAIVSSSVNNNLVMTSPDGVNWTQQAPAYSSGGWNSITYGNGLFVAVGNQNVMTSPDGITWANRYLALLNSLTSITYGNGLFVAVDGQYGHVQTSPDGITWQFHNESPFTWSSVTYGNGLFVAVTSNLTISGTADTHGASNQVMTSPDGITWTNQATVRTDIQWQSVTYGNGLFVAVGALNDRIMTSPDGITWTSLALSLATTPHFYGVTYGNGRFVAVGIGPNTGSPSNRVMTSGCLNPTITATPSLTITQGQSATLTASTGDTYTWSTSEITNPISVSTAGTYSVTVTTGTCSASTSVTLVVNQPMPVALASFSATGTPQHTVDLAWATSLETNNKGFQIDRSKDLIHFEPVGQLSTGEANTQAIKHYQLTDLTPYPGTSYYQLTQTDLSGKATTYPAVAVVLRDSEYGIYPNPLSLDGAFTLRLDEPQTALIQLVNPQGHSIPFQKIEAPAGSLLLKTGTPLPAGVYLITVQERAITRQHRLIVP